MNYVCPECKGVSPEPKNCETEGCAHQGKPLMGCGCEEPGSCECNPETGDCACKLPESDAPASE